MDRWKQVTLASGITVAATILSGCQSFCDARLRAGMKYGHMEEGQYIHGRIDLDIPLSPPKPVRWQDRTYDYYQEFGGIHDRITGEFIRSDHPVWPDLGLPTLGTPWAQDDDVLRSDATTVSGSACAAPTWNAMVNPEETELSIALHCSGDMLVPFWDVERWPTLDRVLYVFPDGVRGSADPMTIEVSGRADDVLGYLTESGLETINAHIDGSYCEVFIHETSDVADVYVDDVLISSIELSR
ncbi:MAG: hypothetical protein QGI78_02585 [Phycisphaerales bacterium]|nr:hypothetical protein [Phycisphaerales bacterium]